MTTPMENTPPFPVSVAEAFVVGGYFAWCEARVNPAIIDAIASFNPPDAPPLLSMLTPRQRYAIAMLDILAGEHAWIDECMDTDCDASLVCDVFERLCDGFDGDTLAEAFEFLNADNFFARYEIIEDTPDLLEGCGVFHGPLVEGNRRAQMLWALNDSR